MNYTDLSEFYVKHNAKNRPGNKGTHTRIPDKKLNVLGGSYIIDDEDIADYYKLYYEHVFIKKQKEYITEKQLDEGAIALDFDFRYDYSVEERQHTPEHILDILLLYLEELKNIFVFTEQSFPVYVFEKPNVNRKTEQNVTKDGIHMIMGIKADRTVQRLLRQKIIGKIKDVLDVPITNDFESVLDEGITKGTTNWQLYGSRKPGNEAYELVQHFKINLDTTDQEFVIDEVNVKDFDLRNNFSMLSVRYQNHVSFNLNPAILPEYNNFQGNKPKQRKQTKAKIKLLVEDDDIVEIADITDKDKLAKAVNYMLDSLKYNEYEIRETHEYTQVLPERFYAPGSHLENRQVAFALKRTDDRLFLSWVMLRSKASDFDYATIPELHNQWKKYFNLNSDGITRRSIMYWAKQYNYDGYETVKKKSIDNALENALNSPTEYDKALILKQMFKDRYVCVSYDKRGIWYRYKNHKWELDRGISIRDAISTQMYDLFSKKADAYQAEYTEYDAGDERAEFIRKKAKIIGDIMLTLKKTNDKNNIVREAMELFYDSDFIKNMDTKKHLLCFNNGVVDFDNKVFRDGYPEDYITKCTNIDYITSDEIEKTKGLSSCKDDIMEFFNKLFPIPELKTYMIEHLASCLIGTNKNQTFNVYHGSGSNGKSILTDLMSCVLGNYKGTVPITLVTEKRGLIGGTSDEILKLKGVRYAVMQEPSKNVKLNEGIMKELTGGDPIQARGLYSESEIFEPQFNLVVCTNNLFDIESNDDGTWRRIRKVDYVAKFVDENETYTDETKYVFKKDKTLKEKLPKFAPVLASILVNKAFETQGIVTDCEHVINASNKYRNNQDHIAAFVSERIVKTDSNRDKIGKKNVQDEFKLWFVQEHGNRKPPKGLEVTEYMNRMFGVAKSTGWHKCKFIPLESDEMDELEDE
ncbi:MAG: hypothetical protein CMC04_03380 [Flavobacteriaceae bacterium]|nr:hypothetical protein [Flavobacteriaceae bacterium]